VIWGESTRSPSSSARLARSRRASARVSATSRDGHPYTIVEGHAATGVTGTTLVLDDGTRVTASIANGWFAAWWPSANAVTAAAVSTATGTTIQHLDTSGPVLCGTGPCTRPAAGLGQSTSVTGGPVLCGTGPCTRPATDLSQSTSVTGGAVRPSGSAKWSSS
jgi:hypothetical protein